MVISKNYSPFWNDFFSIESILTTLAKLSLYLLFRWPYIIDIHAKTDAVVDNLTMSTTDIRANVVAWFLKQTPGFLFTSSRTTNKQSLTSFVKNNFTQVSIGVTSGTPRASDTLYYSTKKINFSCRLYVDLGKGILQIYLFTTYKNIPWQNDGCHKL